MVPIVLYCNSIAKYCNTLVLKNVKVMQQVLQKVLKNMKVLQKVLQIYSSIVYSIAKYESIVKNIV